MNLTARSITGVGMTSQRTRDRMVDRLRDRGIVDEDVIETMAQVPRHLFVDEAMATRAYEDASLPLGEGQTISQPYAVIVSRWSAKTRAGSGHWLWVPSGRVVTIG